ncbi:MAG: CDP-diacylglycerol--serine O-phosphatidyltransferase [Alistipes sp.]|nr:CDP-diacylglycerol--serine O-phosphatidyltransferase [Alistipes sp.]
MRIKLFTIPNCITLLNLLCGMASVVASLVYNDLTLAFGFVLASAVFDFCDGLTARLLNQYSEVGVQLDSLADMVSFGVAPAIAMSVLCGAQPSLFGLSEEVCEWLSYLPFVIALFSALRLAKFNIDDTQKEEFEGLPTPAAAIFCMSVAMLCERYELTIQIEWLSLISVLLAALLVSPIKMFSFKFHEWGLGSTDNKLRFGFLLASCLLICLLRLYAIPLILVMYLVVSTVRWIFKKR